LDGTIHPFEQYWVHTKFMKMAWINLTTCWRKKKGCLFEETFCSIRFFDVTEKEKNSNKSSWYISETYLKGNCQADGYEVIVENYEGQEWHSKVLCLFTYQRVTIFNAVPSNIVFYFLQQYYNHSTPNFKHFPRFKFSYANSSHLCVNQCFNIHLLQPYLPKFHFNKNWHIKN